MNTVAIVISVLVVCVVIFIVLPLTLGIPYELKLPTNNAPQVPQKEEPKTTPCDVCGTDPKLSPLPECQNCPIPEIPVTPGPPINIPEYTGCARFVGMPPGPVKFPENDWTIMLWVKINDFNIPETTILKKGSADLNASPAIVFGKGPEHRNPCIKFNFTTQGSPGIMSIDPQEADVPARPAGSFSSLCPNFTPIVPGTWKFLAWVQRGPEMTYYDGDYTWMYSPNTPIKLSQGNLHFDDANGLIKLKNVAVCNRALLPEEIASVYKRESNKEGISPTFQKLISVSRINPVTKTYRKRREGINGTFYDLISVENFDNQKRVALMRSLSGLKRV